MSFLSFCRRCGNFVNYMIRDKDYTIALLEMRSLLSKQTVYDIYSTLELLREEQPFKETIKSASRYQLQKQVLVKAKYPSHISIDDELIPKWELITASYSKSDQSLSVSVKSMDKSLYLLEITDSIKMFSYDNEGFYYEIESFIESEDEAFKIIFNIEEDEDEAEAIMEDDNSNNVINHVVSPSMSSYISKLDKAFIDRNFD
tara:strand:- start:692 stop:1297 length:606 start_codon:yes stop_codon:yes gene_type:complete